MKVCKTFLFIGSIPIAASNLLNDLRATESITKVTVVKNVVSRCIVVSSAAHYGC